MKKALIVGATGMVGGHLLDECLESAQISRVTLITRRTTGKSHEKLKEVIHDDFSSFNENQEHFENIDIGFFCIGVYTGAVKDDLFKTVTVDYAESFARALKDHSPEAGLCFLSGAGADREEKSRMSFARYKGMAENLIDEMDFKTWHSFRPGYIYPVVPRKEPNLMYKLSRSLYPLIKMMGKNSSIKSNELSRAMLKVGLEGYDKVILENRDIINSIQ